MKMSPEHKFYVHFCFVRACSDLKQKSITASDMVRKTKKMFWGVSLSLALINLAAILERADEGLLPAVYRELSVAFDASPFMLGALTFVRALVQALSSPLAGYLAMRYSRPSVIGIGTVFWGCSTALVAVSQTYTQCDLARAINGVGLAIVIPALQSFVADSYLESGRGVAFGWLNLVGCFGAIGGSMSATIMAGGTFGGIPGWRMAFLLMSLVSCTIGWLVDLFVVDSRGGEPSFHSTSNRQTRGLLYNRIPRGHADVWKESWSAVKAVVKIRTFQIIVLQGLVGSLPWTALVFFTMWLGLIGFGHAGAATLIALFQAGTATGALLGGWLGDQASRRFPGAGRVMCAQFSAFMGIPFSWALLVQVKQDPTNWSIYAAVLFVGGLTISWCQSCANNPIFAEIVPAQNRTIIYAFDRAFEGSFAAIAAPSVGILAEKVWGYRVDEPVPPAGSPAEAMALSKGLFAVLAVPYGLCALCYTALYVSYNRDKEQARSYQSLDLE